MIVFYYRLFFLAILLNKNLSVCVKQKMYIIIMLQMKNKTELYIFPDNIAYQKKTRTEIQFSPFSLSRPPYLAIARSAKLMASSKVSAPQINLFGWQKLAVLTPVTFANSWPLSPAHSSGKGFL